MLTTLRARRAVFFAAFPILYLPRSSGGAGVYHFSFDAEGAAYVTIFIAGVFGFCVYVGYQLFYMGPWIRKNGWPVNEKRLETAIPAAATASIGLWYARLVMLTMNPTVR